RGARFERAGPGKENRRKTRWPRSDPRSRRRPRPTRRGAGPGARWTRGGPPPWSPRSAGARSRRPPDPIASSAAGDPAVQVFEPGDDHLYAEKAPYASVAGLADGRGGPRLGQGCQRGGESLAVAGRHDQPRFPVLDDI